MSQENVDVTRRSLEAWNRGDLDAWLETGHPEIEWISGIASEVEGTEAVSCERRPRNTAALSS
jgi:ketosteroid isomerase-like protein